MRFDTKRQAAQHWVRGFNAIPLDVVIKAVENGNDQGIERFFFDEVEVLGTRNMICTNCDHEQSAGDEKCEECGQDDLVNAYDLPMWGTVWTFDERLDEEWAYQNAEVLADCGFNVYNHNDIGVFIGIDGAGYDFYEAHWIPLYEARGLQWHRENGVA